MATVVLTETLKGNIINNFRASFDSERAQLPQFKREWPMGVGDELYSLLLPLDKEEEIRKLMPKWAATLTTRMPCYSKYAGGWAKFSKPRLSLAPSPVLSAPGINNIRWDGYQLNFNVNDLDKVELPLLKQFLQEQAEIEAKLKEFDKVVDEETAKLYQFLDDHRTLQQAVKEFGPGLLSWVPTYQKNLYEAPAKPRKPRGSKAKEEKEKKLIELSSLQARAVSDYLGMNGDVAKQERDAVTLAKQATAYIPLIPPTNSLYTNTGKFVI